jgi:transposase
VKGDKTLAEVSRELDIQPSVIRECKRRVEAGATTAVATNEDVVPASALREAQQRIRELERLLGRKQMEVEILQAAQEKDGERWSNCSAPDFVDTELMVTGWCAG